ncbi:hypothetical protein D3C78_1628460 [compost metagenome]
MMLLRSMSPEVIIADEIGRPEDGEAIREASHAGISVVATAHAYDLHDARGRPVLRKLLEEGAFASVVELKRTEQGIMHRVISTEVGGASVREDKTAASRRAGEAVPAAGGRKRAEDL